MPWQSAEADKRKGAAPGTGKTTRSRSRARTTTKSS
jgi:hypothetical protein